MKRIDLQGKGGMIFYDVDRKIIGRTPSNSNLKYGGSDNSLYFCSGNNKVDEILCKIFETRDLKTFSGKVYELKFCNEHIKIKFNINKQSQRQLKVLNAGRIYKLYDAYQKYYGKDFSDKTIYDLAFLIDFKNKKLEIKLTYDIMSEDSNSAKELDEFKKEVDQIIEEAHNIGLSSNEINGYVVTQVNARNSQVQKKFKMDLINEFNNKCALCDINKKELLVASHILPYHRCPSVNEMIDCNNGLLLCVTHDALFDKNYITFNQYGKIKISKEIDEKLYDLLNINNHMELDEKYLTNDRIRYMASHNIRNK